MECGNIITIQYRIRIMIRIIVKNKSVKIINSYEVRKKDFKSVLESIDRTVAEELFEKRKISGMCNEWAVHNFAYDIRFMRSHSADVDFTADIKPVFVLFYDIFGPICKLFIK